MFLIFVPDFPRHFNKIGGLDLTFPDAQHPEALHWISCFSGF